MLALISEEELQENYRIDKITYVWNKMTQEERINTILEFCGSESLQDALKEVILDDTELINERSRIFLLKLEDAEVDFEMLSDKDQVAYLIKNLCYLENLDSWFEIENETLANKILKHRIEQHQWFEVMPYNVISEEELNERVLELASFKDDYFVSGIKQVLEEVNKDNIEELTNDEKLMIYGLGQPTY